MLQAYPQVNAALIDETSVNELEWLKNVIVAVRTIRSEMNISPAKQIPILLRKGNQDDKRYYKQNQHLLFTLAKLESCLWIADDETPPDAASAFVGELEIFIPMAGLINIAEESARLHRELAKCQKDFDVISNKLNNPQFVDKAPAEVVAKEKARQAELLLMKEKLNQQLQALDRMKESL
jgi:valyl-tRNA synthetase